jgi:phosphoribosylaminoimidazolecarboxamide formyltransferase/IMP cyclohydrolase
MTDLVPVRRALISLSDKTGLGELAAGLTKHGVEIVSTGGTAAKLRGHGAGVRDISDLTGFPEMMDGRVKTLHPKVHGGLLGVRDNPDHVTAMEEHRIAPIDLVVVNLYPFLSTVMSGADRDTVIENIDIGGPSMVRSAAKNHAFVAIVTDPADYAELLGELDANDGATSLDFRRRLAAKAYALTAEYDSTIAQWFAFADQGERWPASWTLASKLKMPLRYGENPHQRAALYTQVGARRHVLSQVGQLHGKELSFNNVLDLDAARRAVRDFEVPACVIVKHNIPCGAAVARSGLDAYRNAFACDPISAFGGIIALNRRVDAPLAQALSEQFVEVLIAPEYDEDALEILTRKPNVRILADGERRRPAGLQLDLRPVEGALLVQDRDSVKAARDAMEVVTAKRPTDAEWEDLLLCWRVAKHVKSNAIVLARDLATVGIGAGQTSRVDAVKLAVEKAQSPVEGAVLASDAFFPFADGPEAAIAAGVRAIVQPGGSVRDEDSIAVADQAGIVMVLTGRRHFRH